MFAKTFGAAVSGVDASLVQVETNIIENRQLQGKKFYIVGLPDSAVKESEHRIESAMRHFRYLFPFHKTIVNLAPADIRKEGSAYDLPAALAIMKSGGYLETVKLEDYLIMGELALDGKVRSIKGVLPIAIEARRRNFKGVILPQVNAKEASIVNNLNVFGVSSLKEAVDFLNGMLQIDPVKQDTRNIFNLKSDEFEANFSDVQGQENIKRALEIAAAGGHNVIMIGPPGSGKTMLAKRLPGILPPLSLHEALETTKIHSVAGKLDREASLVARRPFRSPHHTVSDVALVGGGGNPQPGEISLAHNGVLFLDELPEFKRSVLEVLRQPLEERKVNIARARMSIDFPANFMLIASMNPCPCGYYNHPDKECHCGPHMVQKYLNRISGPLLDRIDLHVEVTPVSFDEMTAERKSEPSCKIRKRVIGARNIQGERFANFSKLHSNAMMNSQLLKRVCVLDQSGKALLKTAMEKMDLSARAYDRILKVGRTIADLDNSPKIKTEHIAEAITFRSLDRKSWAHGY